MGGSKKEGERREKWPKGEIEHKRFVKRGGSVHRYMLI